MSVELNSSFLGIALDAGSLTSRKAGNCVFLDRRRFGKRAGGFKCKCEKRQNEWIAQAIRFSHFCGKNVELLRKSIGSRNGLVVNCVQEPFVRSKALVKSLAPLWEEGLLLFRCSVFVAVISGVCLLVWYGQKKAKGLIETKLLPSVSSMVSEFIQRDIDFGKVRRVSPLSITLESCSIGPHNEEFSCGEIPTMKLRVRPFASLRRGKIVIDAVLSHPNILVAQKKDYTWLGLPLSEGDGFLRHSSTEEGIDYRTKVRRIAREEAAARWSKDNDIMARAAAEIGYIISERITSLQDDTSREASHSTEVASSQYLACMDEKMHLRDHHCMDTGVDYHKKHADLEKSFGVKIPGSGLKFWSKVVKGPKKQKFKKTTWSDMSAASVSAKKRILERSAFAAAAYFQGLSEGKFSKPAELSGNHDLLNVDKKSTDNIGAETSMDASCQDHILADNQGGKLHEDSEGCTLPGYQKVKDQSTKFDFIRDPFLMSISRLKEVTKIGEKFPSARSAVGTSESDYINVDSEELVIDDVNKNVDEGTSMSEKGDTYQSSTSLSSEPNAVISDSVLLGLLGLRSGLLSLSRNVSQVLSEFLTGPLQTLKSGAGPTVEDVVAELVDGVYTEENVGIEKTLPVTLDSVHFKGGTLMLLAYGDREPR